MRKLFDIRNPAERAEGLAMVGTLLDHAFSDDGAGQQDIGWVLVAVPFGDHRTKATEGWHVSNMTETAMHDTLTIMTALLGKHLSTKGVH